MAKRVLGSKKWQIQGVSEEPTEQEWRDFELRSQELLVRCPLGHEHVVSLVCEDCEDGF
jgi:hypothetical protein